MKKIFLLCTMLILACSMGNAQDLLQGDPTAGAEKNAQKYTEYLNKELALSGKQETLVANNLKELYINIKHLKNSDINDEAYKQRFAVLKENNFNRMRNILTDAQFEKYINLIEKQQEQLMKAKKE